MVVGLMESAETIHRSDGGMDPFKSSPVHPTYVWPAPVSHCGRAGRAFSICMIEERNIHVYWIDPSPIMTFVACW